MTRGHTSNIGAATVIGMATGKVLDTGTRSKVCKSCQVWEKRAHTTPTYRRWHRQHQARCTYNHGSSSGGMEGDVIKDIFHRSVRKYNLRYTRFIGDGDVNTYQKVTNSDPYQGKTVEKLECVGHVQKRLGTRLRNLKKKTKRDKNLQMGKGLLGEED